jgi:hypothetical protein
MNTKQWDAVQARREKAAARDENMMNRARCACGALVMRHDMSVAGDSPLHARSEWVHIGPCAVPDGVIPEWAYEETP